MTQKQALEWAIEKAKEEGLEEQETVLTNLYNTISKKSVKTESAEDIQLREDIKEFMIGKGDLRCTTIGDHFGLSQSKASAILNKMAKLEMIERHKEGKITYFKV